MQKLWLPQMAIDSPRLSAATHVLVTGGRAPGAEWLRAVARDCAVWAIDRGVDACRAAGIVPQRLIGDADSADPDAWHWAQATHAVPTELHPAAKDDTDTQIALKQIDAARKGTASGGIILTGAFGGRLDHAFSTLFSLAGMGLPTVIADEREAIVPLYSGDRCELTFARRPLAVSLLPLTAECLGVGAHGLRWPLDGAALTQRYPYAVSNELAGDGDSCGISVARGALAVYAAFED